MESNRHCNSGECDSQFVSSLWHVPAACLRSDSFETKSQSDVTVVLIELLFRDESPGKSVQFDIENRKTSVERDSKLSLASPVASPQGCRHR